MSSLTAFNCFVRQCLLYPLASPFLPPPAKVEKDYSYANGSKIGTLAAAAAGGLPKTQQTIQYRSGDDGTYKAGLPATGARYTNNGNGTITDNATGLMWVQDPSILGGGDYPNDWATALNTPKTMNWATAIDLCEALNYAGHTDWRLPNIKEICSLVNFSQLTILIGENYGSVAPFTNAKNVYYHSSTTSAAYDTYNAISDFSMGAIGVMPKTGLRLVRPVRLGI